MRLIDVDALIEEHCDGCNEDVRSGCKTDPVCATLMWFQDAPTVDAVPVVRCKDCKHRGTEECPMAWVRCCDDGDGHFDYVDEDETDDYGFCYRGERRADNEP